MPPDTQPGAGPGFRHSVLIVDSDQTVGQVLAPTVRQALGGADGVFMAVSPQTAHRLHEELGATATRLQWSDASPFGQRMGFTYETFRSVQAAAHAAGRRIHIFSEPEVTDGDYEAGPVDRTAAYLAYEAVGNETFAPYGCEMTCVWDARRHSTLMIENVRSLHSHELGAAGLEPGSEFVAPGHYLAGRNQIPLPLPAAVDWDNSLNDLDTLRLLRAELEEWARQHGFSPPAVLDVLLSVNEIVINGLVHGQPPVRVCCWHHEDTLVVQVNDQGGTPLPALAGYRPPAGHQHGNSGLWLARQLADVMQTRTGDGITSVRLCFPHSRTHRNLDTPERLG